MNNYLKIGLSGLLLASLLAGCSDVNEDSQLNKASAKETTTVYPPGPEPSEPKPVEEQSQEPQSNSEQTEVESTDTKNTASSNTNQPVRNSSSDDEEILVVASPESIPVLVNKQNQLPDSYTPPDLVYADIPFIFKGKSEKRKLRAEAAAAIDQLFATAKNQGVSLLGVSGYRSHATQTALFNQYVKRDGYEKARTYSALPGTSEHETGLSIDVTGGNGKCAAESCFAGTPEANWLQQHAAEFGFIIRYPQGKEKITGYKYEPWHLRYVGQSVAVEIMSKGITLEEYFGAVPVNH
jgi:zinc D-Ala-D-Ala carboxypeptidase